MATDVRVPTTGNAGEDAVVVQWNVSVGSAVAAGDVLVVIETAKSTIDIEAPVAGEVLSLRYDVGDEVPEHEVIAVVGTAGEVAESAADPSRIAASPRARILAERRGVPLSALTGSGPAGRIIVADVLAAASTTTSPVLAPASTTSSPVPTPASPVVAEPEFDVVPVRSARRVTAQRMQASLQESAQVTLTRYAKADAMLAYSARLREVTESRGLPKIGVNDLLLFAVARTVGRHPAANSWFAWEGITQFRTVNLGFAVDTGSALLVPVLRDAHRLSLGEVAAGARQLISAARDGKLAPAEMEGGTFTVSNLGSLGVHWFTPVLNTPQSCILGVGATHQLHDDGPRLLPLSLTFDHRAIDGAASAALLADLVAAIESVDVLAAL